MARTNDRAYSFEYDLGSGRGYEWRVWRPDRVPHHFGHYKTEEAAQRSADRINTNLGIETPERIGVTGSFGIWRLNGQVVVGDGVGNDLYMLPWQIGEVIALLDMARQELELEP